MTAVSKPPLPPADINPPAAAPTPLKSRALRPRSSSPAKGTTPSFLRRWNVVLLALVAAFAVVGSAASLVMRSASETTANNTAPALIGIQSLFASVAEANTASTAAFLAQRTDSTDRVNRNLYYDAIRRASEQTEEVSAIFGDDPAAHRALKNTGISLNTYSGQIEAARVANANDLPGADEQLRQALSVVQNDVGQSVATVNARGQLHLDEERNTGLILTILAIILGVITVLALLRAQIGLLQRTNRILNPLLVLATALILIVLGYLIIGPATRSRALDDAASGGLTAIETTSDIQTAAFELQSELSLRLLEEDRADLTSLFAQVDADLDRLANGADSDRERAAAETLRIRWVRYQNVARSIEDQADRGDLDAAIEQFRGEGLAAFNGLNTAIESVLSDNRTQFISGVDRAASAVGTTPFLTIILPVLAALAILLAIQRRLGEYR